MSAPPAISCHGLETGPAGRSVLRNVCFDIPPGTVTAVLGPNGAGKTTLFRTLLGLIRPARGTLALFGQPVKTGRRDVGYLPQTRTPAGPTLSGRTHILAALQGSRTWGLPDPRGPAELDRLLQELGVSSLADRPFGSLSGGERQKLLLVQALLGQPRLLILDEPLAGLDPAHMQDVAVLAGKLAREKGLTVLMSTHDINPLADVTDQVLYLAGGEARFGTSDDVLTSPVLSTLYGCPVEVFRTPSGQVFVSAGRT
ncbi:ATP-binding cassette domain-containing protein [Acetobacter sp. AN02]|uniref:metal ABC transporter ATP-binding protein n=1 Tax=Acetobacter sp. AN02 TaxID=2894186 RepID=UPI002434323E|nr:ATP-binding cassette domain-containing protein [Acetobacter sp. AN02]MDG6095427.1 ATP-binding cassette domain-containing protein [Acetobacter sp. AN02]